MRTPWYARRKVWVAHLTIVILLFMSSFWVWGLTLDWRPAVVLLTLAVLVAVIVPTIAIDHLDRDERLRKMRAEIREFYARWDAELVERGYSPFAQKWLDEDEEQPK